MDTVDPAQDQQWQEEIMLTLTPNSKLNPSQQALVEKDFGMPDGRLQISVKKALAHYTLQRYQAAITLAEAEDALKHPLVLQRSDIEKLSAYRFDQAS